MLSEKHTASVTHIKSLEATRGAISIDMAKYQNHERLMALHSQYFPNLVYVSADRIVKVSNIKKY